jgi:hypothetical protein
LEVQAMRPVELATRRSREELLRRSLCAGESSVEYVLYSEDRNASPKMMFIRCGDEIYEAVLGSPKAAHPIFA